IMTQEPLSLGDDTIMVLLQVKLITSIIKHEHNIPSIGFTPAINEKAIAPGNKASASNTPESVFCTMLPFHCSIYPALLTPYSPPSPFNYYTIIIVKIFY